MQNEKSMNSYIMSPEDAKIRKNWCIATVLVYLGLPILNLVVFNFLSLKFEVSSKILNQQAGFLVLGTIWFLISYYFVYRRHGVFLLTWTLITLPIKLIMNLLEFFHSLQDPTETWAIYALLIDTSCCIWWALSMIKLRRLNKRIHAHKLYSSKGYLQALQALQLVSTLDDLNAKFASLMREREENGQRGDLIIEAYNTRKNALHSLTN
jgi:hypothetical protein